MGETGAGSLPVLLITGPGGVGKTTVAFEVCRSLESAGIAHAMIDTDELDRIFPAPDGDPHKSLLTRRNLAAVWANLRAAGAPRLILTMVAPSIEEELSHVREAIPEATVTVIRLRASEDDLLERVHGREVGSGYGYQAARTIEQARLMEREPTADRIVIDTSDSTVDEVTREVLARAGWLSSPNPVSPRKTPAGQDAANKPFTPGFRRPSSSK